MSFTFLRPGSSRRSSNPARRSWSTLSLFSIQKPPLRASDPSFAPPVDVYETEDEVLVRMEIAGIDPTTVNIVIIDNEGLLTIRGQRSDPAAGQPRKYHNMEIECGSFSREVRLPAEVDESQASAHYSDGFLLITLPKAKLHPQSSRSVPIE